MILIIVNVLLMFLCTLFTFGTDIRNDQVIINHTNPIWVCQNAMKQDEDCLFCKCNECYMKESNKHVTTNISSRRSMRCRRNNNAKEGLVTKKTQQYATAKTYVACDHDTLICSYESAYFTREYIAVREKKKHTLPTICSICKREILNKLDEMDTTNDSDSI